MGQLGGGGKVGVTADDRNPASPHIYIYVCVCIHVLYSTRVPMLLAYDAYITSCRISIVSSPWPWLLDRDVVSDSMTGPRISIITI